MSTETANAKDVARKDVYQIINDRLIEQLEKGTAPWQQPWTVGGLPKNIISKNFYRGINMMLLFNDEFEHNLFISFKQLKDIGGKVKKGEKAFMIVYWKPWERKNKGTDQNEETIDTKKKYILRYHYVFNIAQCENIPDKYLPLVRETKELPSCESIVNAMPLCPPIHHKEQSAFYDFKHDFVNMPKKNSFKNDESYYATLFHELVHSTGHESRLNRDTVTQMTEIGGDTYSLEELVAEIGTCYLQSVAGIASDFQQSTAYIKGWLAKLKGDKRFIFRAAKESQKAVDYILNRKDIPEDVPHDEE